MRGHGLPGRNSSTNALGASDSLVVANYWETEGIEGLRRRLGHVESLRFDGKSSALNNFVSSLVINYLPVNWIILLNRNVNKTVKLAAGLRLDKCLQKC